MSSEPIVDRDSQIDIEQQDRLHEGFRPVDGFRFAHKAVGDSDWEHPISREIVRSPHVVAVLPYDPSTGRLVLLRQFRLGAHLAHGKGMMIEIVAGGVEDGEDAEDAARRELTEETGLTAETLTPVAWFLSSPGISDEYVGLYLARVDASALPERTGYDAHEIIYPFTCTPEQAVAAADGNAISNVFTLLALNWFDRHKHTIQTDV